MIDFCHWIALSNDLLSVSGIAEEDGAELQQQEGRYGRYHGVDDARRLVGVVELHQEKVERDEEEGAADAEARLAVAYECQPRGKHCPQRRNYE